MLKFCYNYLSERNLSLLSTNLRLILPNVFKQHMAAHMPVLTFWERNPPYGAFLAAKAAKSKIIAQADPKATKETVPALTFVTGEQLVGLPMVIRYLVRAGEESDGVYGRDALAACQVDYWLDYSTSLSQGGQVEAICTSLNTYLTPRSFLVGYAPTAADFAVWGQLQGSPLWKKVRGSGKVTHLVRWFDYTSSLPEAAAVLSELEAAKKPAVPAGATTATVTATKGGGDTGSFDIDLPGAAPGLVVTRFPPEPSGYLHIGHAKAALLNQHFADMYQGKLIVRFDDTNPSKEKDEFVENILKDMRDLGLRWSRLTHTSDYFPQLMEVGEKLIRAGVMYADDTPVETMREERLKCIESRCRGRSVEENLKLWEEMKLGSEVGLTNCMRFKLDMASANGCLRDPVAFRCNLTPHWRTGTKYKVYPTYDFACPFVDSVEGVTHALRTSEYKDREAQYYWVLKAIQAVWPGLPDVYIWDYSRLNFINTVLSKRKLTWFVDTGRVDSWADPRMPTVQGILRRGMRIEALREFILSQGASKNTTYQEWDKIWTINKKFIDPVSPRHTAVNVSGRVPLQLVDGPAEPEVVTANAHPKNPAVGKKSVIRTSTIWLDGSDAAQLAEGEEVTLMGWGNAIIKSITRSESGVPSSLSGCLNLAGDVKTTKLKLTWLPEIEELVALTLVDFDFLISKRKVEEDDDFMTLVNPTTRFETEALGDPNMRRLQKGDIIQLERRGYFIVDEPLLRPGVKPMVLFSIPDGRSKPMAK